MSKVVRGKRVGGLRRYLFGPETSNEHTDCHLAAARDEPASLEPRPLPPAGAMYARCQTCWSDRCPQPRSTTARSSSMPDRGTSGAS